MSLFNITSNDLQRKIEPSLEGFILGELLTQQDLDDLIRVAEEMVVSSLPYKYRRSLSKIQEALTYKNRSVSTTFSTSFTPLTGTLKVYVNYGKSSFENRNDYDLTDIPYTLAGKVITFERAIGINDSVFVEYEHDNTEAFVLLKDVAVNLACVEISKRTYLHRENDARERFIEWEDNSKEYLDKLQKGLIGISAIDNIQKIETKADGNNVEDMFDFVKNMDNTYYYDKDGRVLF